MSARLIIDTTLREIKETAQVTYIIYVRRLIRHKLTKTCSQQQLQSFYSHYSGLCNVCYCVSRHPRLRTGWFGCFTASVILLTATSIFGLRRKRYGYPQRWYVHW